MQKLHAPSYLLSKACFSLRSCGENGFKTGRVTICFEVDAGVNILVSSLLTISILKGKTRYGGLSINFNVYVHWWDVGGGGPFCMTRERLYIFTGRNKVGPR